MPWYKIDQTYFMYERFQTYFIRNWVSIKNVIFNFYINMLCIKKLKKLPI